MAGIINKIICILIALTISIFSLIQIPQPDTLQLSDKINHLIAYTLLAFFFIFAFKQNTSHFILLSIISVCACTFYGSIMEFLQSFTNRNPELLDVLADLTGSTIGTLTAMGVIFIKKKLRP